MPFHAILLLDKWFSALLNIRITKEPCLKKEEGTAEPGHYKLLKVSWLVMFAHLLRVTLGMRERSFHSSLRGTVRNSHRTMLLLHSGSSRSSGRELSPPMATPTIGCHAQGAQHWHYWTLILCWALCWTLYSQDLFSASQHSSGEGTSPIAILTQKRLTVPRSHR